MSLKKYIFDLRRSQHKNHTGNRTHKDAKFKSICKLSEPFRNGAVCVVDRGDIFVCVLGKAVQIVCVLI